jgi:hypothetical protein
MKTSYLGKLIYLIHLRPIPDSIADLTEIEIFVLNAPNSLSSRNIFTGRLPFRMGSLQSLTSLYVNVPTLSGPLPEFYRAGNLEKCDFTSADYCREWKIPANSRCNFAVVPMCNKDCMVLYEWIQSSPGRCCSSTGISCDKEDRIIAM